MPIEINSYQYDYCDPTLLKEPQLVGKPRKSYPIDGNSSIYIEEEDYMVLIDFYQPLQPAARHPERANVFYIKDAPISDIGNGVGRFTRTWSVLPGYGQKDYVRSEYESFALTIPALDTAQIGFYQFPVASYTLSGGNHVLTVTTAAPPFNALDIEANKPATVFYIVTDPLNGQQSTRQVVKKALAVTSNTITVSFIGDIGPITITGVQRADVNQPSYTKQVMSRVDYTYFVPGVNCNSVNDIPIIQELQIIDDATGGRVEYLSETTTPDLDSWYDGMANNEWFVVEPSVVRRWMGEIYERSTRYVRFTL